MEGRAENVEKEVMVMKWDMATMKGDMVVMKEEFVGFQSDMDLL